ncbi:DUF2946 domain-containing protein [Pseudomonas monteilii]|uniref:DUF2946 domain-containing protein n=1 Tax=Pseudomonas monteilii TaxID=76759 RepID=UPI001CBAAF94|nr:DUF2946 domain-containing protein [Pseudomonas monteilii]MBZ3662541.1 DUF2946 domain-containing protein [Pseudomonas monteilii]MBZ3667867.1 DUF2946 domain-containing protein [Pseudomonas monteilii]
MSLPRNSISRTTRPDRRRAGGGWLSLFAMWMIFIGPLISQSMPMDHHAGMSMPMTAAHQHGGDTHHGHGNDGQLHVMWEKCGYCSLLFNCPALPQALSPLSAGRVVPTTHLLAPTHQGHARQAAFPGARSRAPPSSISV